MSICKTDLPLITKTTFKRVNNALLFNDVWFFFLAGLQSITNFCAGENWLVPAPGLLSWTSVGLLSGRS